MHTEAQKAFAFALFLCLMASTFLTLAVTSIDRVVLGTELNTNGMVEYLCLGNGCDNLIAMDW